MTNTEYEAASIAAANTAAKFEGEHKLEQCDKAISVLEESLARLQAERREIVNRYDLNKCEHSFVWHMQRDLSSKWACSKCGVDRVKDDDQHSHMVD